MSKPFSESDFIRLTTQDRTWRLKEISDLRSAILRADSGLRRVLLRALVTISYAHWEGFVRFAARKYLEHIALRKFQYQELDRQFLRNYFMPRLAALCNAKTSLSDRCGLVDDILTAKDRRFSKANDELVNTRSNLNSEVIADICLVCGLPNNLFEEDAAFIDVILLKRRNEIAHGEESIIAIDDLETISGKAIGLMRKFGDALENRVCLQDYKAESLTW